MPSAPTIWAAVPVAPDKVGARPGGRLAEPQLLGGHAGAGDAQEGQQLGPFDLYQEVMRYRLGDEVKQVTTPLLITGPMGLAVRDSRVFDWLDRHLRAGRVA
jgi:hypothetical protein